MSRAARRSLLLSILRMASFLAVTTPVVAQEPDLSGLANLLAERIASRKVRSVVVADFLSPLGAESPTGKYLAAKLTESWAQHDQKFSVLDREKLEAALTQQNETAKDLGDSRNLKGISKIVNADAIIVGTVEVLEDRFTLFISMRKLSDGMLVTSGEQSFSRSGKLESLNQGSSPLELDSIPRAGLNGVGTPMCEYCPQPEFPTEARVAKIHHALVLLDIVVTPQGSSAAIRILKDPRYGFAENAVRAVRGWRFRPAVDKDKSPIAARVQIEVSFHDQ
jgi:TonB family protein